MKPVILILLVLPQLLYAQIQNTFVKTTGHNFTMNGKPYYFIGTNYWYGALLPLQKDIKKGTQRLQLELDFLESQGIRNLRVLVGSEGTGIINGVNRVAPSLQPEKGVFNESVLSGLDFLLVEMGKRNMKAVLYLSNNWEWSGGFLQYLNWYGHIADSTLQRKPGWDELRDQVSLFYSCDSCKLAYEKQLRYILGHTNQYSGTKYTEDPAIMSWEIANEPRPMRPAAIDAYTSWTLSVASLLKSLDSNHLVTLGTEGTIGTENSKFLYASLHSPAAIDYLSIHIWPKNWAWYSDTAMTKGMPGILQKTKDYILQHERLAEKINKPLVIEEFGLPRDEQSFASNTPTTARDTYFRFVLGMQQKSIAKKGVIAGVNFWAFGGTARPIPGQLFWKEGDDYMGDPPQEEQGLNAVFDRDKSTWTIIKSFTEKIK